MLYRSAQVALLTLAIALALAFPARHAVAEPQATALTSRTLEEATQSIRRFRRDASGRPAYLARFSDGPRFVPVPRGAAKARAERLGLGGREVTRTFFWSRPDAALLGEVRGELPKNLLWPVVDGHYGRGFGYTRTLRPELHHNGIDIGAKEGAVVRAAADGLVVYSNNGLPGYGNCVMVLHQNGWLTLYAHNKRNTVQVGWRVKRGERIALVGETGYAWGPHLHFELRDNGRLRDPKPLITGWRSDEVNGPLVSLEADEPMGLAETEAATEAVAEKATEAVAEEATEERAEVAATPLALASVEHFLRETPSAEELSLAGGRVFRNLLWPVKDGALSSKHPRVTLRAPVGSGVRAAADGVVVHSGKAKGHSGDVVVVLHANGWVTVYDGLAEIAVKPLDRLLRGQWMARVAAESGEAEGAVRFEWRVDGKLQDPSAFWAGAP